MEELEGLDAVKVGGNVETPSGVMDCAVHLHDTGQDGGGIEVSIEIDEFALELQGDFRPRTGHAAARHLRLDHPAGCRQEEGREACSGRLSLCRLREAADKAPSSGKSQRFHMRLQALVRSEE